MSYSGLATANENPFKPNWLAVSDSEELERTWRSAFVALPEALGNQFGYLLNDEVSLNDSILNKLKGEKLPLLVFIGSCEGLGHHREDIERFAQLGFVVIAPDSMARKHRPYGCYEDQEIYTKYHDIGIAFQKAELDYAVERMQSLPWVNQEQRFLFGSGTGGMVVAHYQGSEFTGHVIEGWGCNHPHSVFNGIWAPVNVRIYSVVSKNDRWFKDKPGFEIDCAQYLNDRPDSEAIVLDRPAHYVSWYPGSRTKLIRFLTRDLDVDHAALIDDTPVVIESSENGIVIRPRWSVEDVYAMASEHCKKFAKTSYISGEPNHDTYRFICS